MPSRDHLHWSSGKELTHVAPTHSCESRCKQTSLVLAESRRMQKQQQPEQERWSLKSLLSASLDTNLCLPLSQQLLSLIPITAVPMSPKPTRCLVEWEAADGALLGLLVCASVTQECQDDNAVSPALPVRWSLCICTKFSLTLCSGELWW